MNRVWKRILWIVGCAAVGAVVWMFSDYYNAIFGRYSSRATRVVETDTWGRMETRAMWGALVGACLGVYMAVRGARRNGKDDEE